MSKGDKFEVAGNKLLVLVGSLLGVLGVYTCLK